jgi:hypothetical protein
LLTYRLLRRDRQAAISGDASCSGLAIDFEQAKPPCFAEPIPPKWSVVAASSADQDFARRRVPLTSQTASVLRGGNIVDGWNPESGHCNLDAGRTFELGFSSEMES